jgi:AAA15 family ATPase/GTPase
MLTKFTVTNFKNFKDPFTFDLTQTKKFEFNEACVRNGIVNNALIYGPNGSGKSNLGFALFDIIANISDKQKRADMYSTYLNAESDSDLAEFQYNFLFNDITLKYIYGKRTYEDISYEQLFINDELVINYDRREKNNTKATILLKGAGTLNTDLSQIKISVVKYVKNNAVLAENDTNRALIDFFFFVDNMLHFRSLEDRFYQGYEVGINDMFEDMIQNNNIGDFISFLKRAEIVCDLEVITVNNQKKLAFKFGNKTIDFWKNASSGTHALSLFYYWLQKIKKPINQRPTFIFIDEFDAFYHQSVSESIVRELIGFDFQTILTTHNTSLMTNDLLRPDCYFVINKNSINPFSSLTDKDIRKAHNIEKMYKAGSFNNE